MKKRIIFITNSLGLGGIEKSIIEILKVINNNEYQIDLLLLNGITTEDNLLDKLPLEVNILPSTEIATMFFKPFCIAVKQLFKNKKIGLILIRIIFAILSKYASGSKVCKKINYSIVRKIYPKITTTYCFAVCVRYEYPAYYTIDHIKAKKKYIWLHTFITGMEVLKFSVDMEKEYLPQFDKIICVSETVRNNYLWSIPELSNKSVVIHNLIDKEEIMGLADMPIDHTIREFKGVKFVSAMRMSVEKRPDFIIEVAKQLKNDGFDFMVVLIGSGDMLEVCKKRVKEYHLEKEVIFLGFLSNPYPYIKACDVYIQPSVFETWGISITEAKFLGKPAITTNFECAYEQITDGNNGYIANSDEEFYLRCREILHNPNIIRTLAKDSSLELDQYLEDSKNSIHALFSI